MLRSQKCLPQLNRPCLELPRCLGRINLQGWRITSKPNTQYGGSCCAAQGRARIRCALALYDGYRSPDNLRAKGRRRQHRAPCAGLLNHWTCRLVRLHFGDPLSNDRWFLCAICKADPCYHQRIFDDPGDIRWYWRNKDIAAYTSCLCSAALAIIGGLEHRNSHRGSPYVRQKALIWNGLSHSTHVDEQGF